MNREITAKKLFFLTLVFIEANDIFKKKSLLQFYCSQLVFIKQKYNKCMEVWVIIMM